MDEWAKTQQHMGLPEKQTNKKNSQKHILQCQDSNDKIILLLLLSMNKILLDYCFNTTKQVLNVMRKLSQDIYV